MHYSLMIGAIIMTGYIAASKGADVLDAGGNDAHWKHHQDQTQDYADFMKAFDSPQCQLDGFTRNGDLIYVLCSDPSLKSIRVFEDSQPFDLLVVIWLEEVKHPFNLVSSQASGCLYIIDKTVNKSRIWKIKIDDHSISEFLFTTANVYGLSVNTNGQLVVSQTKESSEFVEIYSPDAALVRRIDLPIEKESPGAKTKAILKPNGELIVIYGLHTGWVISLVTADGEITRRYVNLSNPASGDPGVRCWTFETDDQDNGANSEPTCFPNRPMSYMILEELVVPLFLNFYNATRQSYNILLLDVKVAFGIHSTKSQIVFHKCY